MSLVRERRSEAQERLNALDSNDEEYEVKKMVAESRVANLNELVGSPTEDAELWRREAGYKGLQDEDEISSPANGSQSRPQSSSAIYPPQQHGFAAYAGSSHNTLGGHFASDGPMAGQGRLVSAPQWGFASPDDISAASATPNDSNSNSARQGQSSASVSSPDSSPAVPQKRRKVDHGIVPVEAPLDTGAASPASIDSLDLLNNVPEDLYGLFGGDPRIAARELRDSLRQQEEHDRMLAARREQERLDEEFALSLQNQENGGGLPPTSSDAGPSARPSAQTYFNPSGAYSRPPIQSSSPLMKMEDPFGGHSNNEVTGNGAYIRTSPAKTEFKREGGNHDSINQYRSGPHRSDYITIDSDDDDLAVAAMPSANDVFEVDPQIGRPINYFDSSTNSLDMTTNPYNSMTSAITGAAQGLYNTASNFVGQSALGQSLGLGGMPVYGGSGATPSTWVNSFGSSFDDYSIGMPWEQNLNRMGINQNDPSNQELMDRYRDRYDYLVNDPTRTRDEIKDLLENIRPDEDLPPEDREGTPEAMTYPLMEHQKLGLAWMKRMEEGTNRGGILADDMGLGKTIQALALMASRRSENPACKTTLIVAPVALLKQWEREIQKKLKTGSRHKMSTFILHGNTRHTAWEKLRTFDVVLTTYGVLATEAKRQDEIETLKAGNPNWRPTGKNDKLCLLGENCHWYRVIVDEAQCIKNKLTKAAVGACRLRADTRFCMTGTPMMNSVTELYALIRFLKIRPYCEERRFSTDIGKPLKSVSAKYRDRAMEKLQALLKSILLRRTKKSEIDGRPILNLPERTTAEQHAEFNDEQAAFYRALESRTQLQFNRYLRAGTIGRHYSNILVLLLRLRQACCHPHLIKDFGHTGNSASDLSPEEMIELAQSLGPDAVKRIKEAAAQNDFTSLECPVCMDMADNATIFVPCGHDTCSECFARISDPASAIAEGDFGERNVDAKCPSCRAQVTPRKVIDFNTFKTVHAPEHCKSENADDKDDAGVADGSDSETSDEEADEESDEEIDRKGNLKDFIIDDDAESTTDDEEDSKEEKSKPKPKKKAKSAKKEKQESKGKGKSKAEKGPKKTLAQLKKEAGSSARARRQYLKRLEKDWESSSKIDKVMELLHDIQSRVDPETKQCEKTIIFSQFTSLLDLLEVPISQQDWEYRRYDGSMNPKARNDAVIDFTDKANCRIMLVSLKAGNAGLNLTAASQVIVFDPFWNPFIEEQAIDRAHRIGQMKPVRVHRILVPNTVEDRILALQERKRELIERALDEKASRDIGRLSTRDLAFLFDVPS